GSDGKGLLRLKGAVAVTQQHAYRNVSLVGDDQVQFTVAIDIRGRDRVREEADTDNLLRLEGAIAIAQQHAQRVVAGVGHDEVEYAVPVDVRRRHGALPRACRDGGLDRERGDVLPDEVIAGGVVNRVVVGEFQGEGAVAGHAADGHGIGR